MIASICDQTKPLMLAMSYRDFEEFCDPICNFRAARYKFTKVSQCQGKAIDTFYNRILKLAHQCDFKNMEERLIDAIIFGMNCVKAQDKLIQTPKTLSLQQCLTICRHYESLKLHIQQICPSDKYIEFLKKNITQRRNRDPSKDLKQSPTPQHNQMSYSPGKHNRTSLYTENVVDVVTIYTKTELRNAKHGAKHAENVAT